MLLSPRLDPPGLSGVPCGHCPTPWDTSPLLERFYYPADVPCECARSFSASMEMRMDVDEACSKQAYCTGLTRTDILTKVIPLCSDFHRQQQ